MSASISSASTKVSGDISSGRGQFGLTVYHTAAANLVQDVIGVPTAANPFTDYFYRYSLDTSIGNFTFTLEAIGTSSSQVQPGYTMYIVNRNATSNITILASDGVTTIYKLSPSSMVALSALSAANTWSILDIAPLSLVYPLNKMYNATTTDGVTFVTAATIPITQGSALLLRCIAAGHGTTGLQLSGGYAYLVIAKNVAGVVTQIGAVKQVIGEQSASMDITSIVSSPNILVQVRGSAGLTMHWTLLFDFAEAI